MAGTLPSRTARSGPFAEVPDDAVDWGSPYDIAYGQDDDTLDWLPQPLASISAGLPDAPAVTRDWWLNAIIAAEVVLLAALLAWWLAPTDSAPVLTPKAPDTPVAIVGTDATLAAAVERDLTSGGFEVRGDAGAVTASMHGDTVMYAPGELAAALATASRLGIDRVEPLHAVDASQLGDAKVVVALGQPAVEAPLVLNIVPPWPTLLMQQKPAQPPFRSAQVSA